MTTSVGIRYRIISYTAAADAEISIVDRCSQINVKPVAESEI